MTPVSSATLALPVRPRRRRGGLAEKIAPYSYIAPFFVLFLAFGLGPLIYTGWVSLHHWEPLQIEHEFVGLQNYRVMLEDPRFWQAVRNTFAIFALSTIPGLVLALILASLLRKPRLRMKTFWRMTLLVPNITPLVTVSLVFLRRSSAVTTARSPGCCSSYTCRPSPGTSIRSPRNWSSP